MSCNFQKPRASDVRSSDTLSEISESGTTNSGWTSGWDSREDLRDFVTKIGLNDVSDLYQDRFKVDRKKLEQMLSGDDQDPWPADIFFEKIMDDTNTFITWPSKLKIGAKSKKDPHVRIAGKPEDVVAAKERIRAVLHIRRNRVTMKIDVSYTDHSHIIGKGGLSIKRVMEETQCHVHFPDSNRSNVTEKSNQVSIAGDIEGVELARSRVRQKTPLVFGFELPIMSQNVDPTCDYIMKVQEQYNVQMMLRTRPKLHATLVLIKGVEWEVDQVKKATKLLIKFLCGNLANQIPVQMSIEIAPHHHEMVIGKNHANLKEIMRVTGAQIMFPDAHDPNIPSLKKSNVTISGNIHNVYAARQLLIGSLPLLLIFDLPECSAGLPTRPEQVAEIQSKYDVSINIRLKSKQNTMACIIKGTERSASNIYNARNAILALDDPIITADIPSSYHLPPQSTQSPHDLPTPTPLNPQPMSPMLSPLYTPRWHYPPSAATTNPQSHFVRMVPQPHFTFNNTMQSSMASSGYQSMGHFSGSSSLEHSRDNSTYSSISSASFSLASSPRNTSPYQQRSFLEGLPVEKMEVSSVLSDPDAGGYQRQGEKRQDWNPSPSSLADYEQKKIAGYKAMQAQPSGDSYRYPTGNWIGYGISNTSPAPLNDNISSTSNNNDMEDDIWKSSNGKNLCVPSSSTASMNTSNFLDHTPSKIVNRLTSGKLNDLSTLLTSLGLEKYIGLLTSHEIDLTTFASITDKDLIELGITAFGARRKMLLAISELNKRGKPFSMAPGAERKSSSSSSTLSNNSPQKW